MYYAYELFSFPNYYFYFCLNEIFNNIFANFKLLLLFNFSKHIILYLQCILLIFEKFWIDINSNPSITPTTKILLSIINFAEKYYLYYLNILTNDYMNNNNYMQKYKILIEQIYFEYFIFIIFLFCLNNYICFINNSYIRLYLF